MKWNIVVVIGDKGTKANAMKHSGPRGISREAPAGSNGTMNVFKMRIPGIVVEGQYMLQKDNQ